MRLSTERPEEVCPGFAQAVITEEGDTREDETKLEQPGTV
jgi:hypothetical protein